MSRCVRVPIVAVCNIFSTCCNTGQFFNQIITVPYNTTMLFYPGMATCFGLERLLSGHYYKNFKIRCNAVQIMFVI